MYTNTYLKHKMTTKHIMDCLIIKDLDEEICSHLSPSDILTLSEVNKHYYLFTHDRRIDIDCIRDNFSMACIRGNVWMAKWILSRRDNSDMDCEHHEFDPCKCFKCTSALRETLYNTSRNRMYIDSCDVFLLACKNGHLAMAQWILSLPYNCFKTEREEIVYDFLLYREEYPRSIINWYESYLSQKNPHSFYFSCAKTKSLMK